MNRKEFVIVLTITFIVIIVWIISDIIHTKASVPTDPKVQKILEPIDPNLDPQALQLIQNPPTITIPTITPAPQAATSSARQP